jgi:DNA-binding MarR family transcriptional regulator
MTTGSEDALKAHIEEIDKLVHEPARLLLMAHLYVVDGADFVYLLDQTGLTAGNVSSHMRKLVAADYVEMEKAFVGNRPQTTYSLSRAGRKAFEAYRENIAEILQMLSEEER